MQVAVRLAIYQLYVMLTAEVADLPILCLNESRHASAPLNAMYFPNYTYRFTPGLAALISSIERLMVLFSGDHRQLGPRFPEPSLTTVKPAVPIVRST